MKNETKIQKFLCLIGGLMIATGLSVFAARAEESKPQDKPAAVEEAKAPVITPEIERDFERARADEQESARAHDVDTAKLQAAFAVIQKACPGVQRPERGKPLVCPPAPEKKP